jgi:hypothetical protein
VTILYDASAPVKSTRPFGLGLTAQSKPATPKAPAAEPSRPEPSRKPYEPSEADRAWWAEESERVEREREARSLNAHYDDLAADSLATDLLCLGVCFA